MATPSSPPPAKTTRFHFLGEDFGEGLRVYKGFKLYFAIEDLSDQISHSVCVVEAKHKRVDFFVHDAWCASLAFGGAVVQYIATTIFGGHEDDKRNQLSPSFFVRKSGVREYHYTYGAHAHLLKPKSVCIGLSHVCDRLFKRLTLFLCCWEVTWSYQWNICADVW